jgi:hypothetical protein
MNVMRYIFGDGRKEAAIARARFLIKLEHPALTLNRAK